MLLPAGDRLRNYDVGEVKVMRSQQGSVKLWDKDDLAQTYTKVQVGVYLIYEHNDTIIMEKQYTTVQRALLENSSH